MLRKLKFALAIASTITMAGCATSGGGGGLTQDQINALIQQIQAFTAQACSYQPQASGVLALITAFFPASAPFATIVNTVGDAICKAPITAAAVKRGTTQVTRIVQTPKGPVAVTGVTYGAVK